MCRTRCTNEGQSSPREACHAVLDERLCKGSAVEKPDRSVEAPLPRPRAPTPAAHSWVLPVILCVVPVVFVHFLFSCSQERLNYVNVEHACVSCASGCR